VSIDVRVATTVRKPRAVVASVLFDPRYEPDWRAAVLDAYPVEDKPLRAGARIERVTRFLGVRQTDVAEVLELAPDRFLEIAVFKPFPMKQRLELEGIPEGAIVHLRLRGRLPWWWLPARPLLRTTIRRSAIRDLTNLKRFMESNEYRRLDQDE